MRCCDSGGLLTNLEVCAAASVPVVRRDERPRPLPRRRAAGTLEWVEEHVGLVVFGVAVVARLAWVLPLPDSLTWIDEEQFAAIARDLARGHGYSGSTYRGNPVLPWFLAAFVAVFGEDWTWPRAAQAVIGAVTCVLVARLGDVVAGRRAGLLAGLACALYPANVYLAGVFYVDVLFTFFLVLAVLLLTRARQAPRRVAAGLVAGIVLGLGVLTRPVLLALVPAAALVLVPLPPRGLRALLPALALLAATASTIAPWTARNHRVHGRFVLVSSGLATKLWEGNNELARGDADDRDLRWTRPIWQRRLAELPPAERARVTAFYDDVGRRVDERLRERDDYYLVTDEVLGPIARRYMAEHPWRTLALFGAKVRTLYAAFSDTATDNAVTRPRARLVAAATWYPILGLAAVGLAIAVRRRLPVAPLLAAVVALTVAYGLLDTCTRFRLPLDPLLMVLAAVPLASPRAADAEAKAADAARP